MVKSAHSYRGFPSDFFAENMENTKNKSSVRLPHFDPKKSIDSDHVKNLKIVDHAKFYEKSGANRYINQDKNNVSPIAVNERGSHTDRFYKKLKVNSSLGRRESAGTIENEGFSQRVYGEHDLEPRRSHTNHG